MAAAAVLAAVLTTALLSGGPAQAARGKLPACTDKHHIWGFEEGHHSFRIWYRVSKNRQEAEAEDSKARYLKEQMDGEIWPRETKLMGTHPISDPLEICLVDDVGANDNSIGNTKTERGCNVGGVGAEILVLDSLGEKDSRDVLAHEFMHALQFSLRVPCTVNKWWQESTAEWAEDFVYPHDNREHGFAHFYTGDADKPLPDKCDCDKNREYGSYLFPFFIARTIDPEYIGRIWRKAQQVGVLKAIDEELPGGLKKQWPEFAKLLWNGDTQDYFKEWDGIKDGANEHTPEQVLTPGTEDALKVEDLNHLAIKYYSYKVVSGVRTIGVTIPYPYFGGVGNDQPDEHAHLTALIDIQGGSQEVKDWTGHGFKHYCFALPHQHITKLTLIFSNSNTTEDFTAPEPAYVVASNVACKEWSGTISGEDDNPFGRTGLKVTSQTEVTFVRHKTSPDHALLYVPMSGGINWFGGGQTSSNGVTCTYSGSGSAELNSLSGFLNMEWGLRTAPGFFGPRDYSGSVGSPLFYFMPGHCSDGSTPTADATLPGWSSGPKTLKVSGDGTQMTGDYTLTGQNGEVASWHWSLHGS